MTLNRGMFWAYFTGVVAGSSVGVLSSRVSLGMLIVVVIPISVIAGQIVVEMIEARVKPPSGGVVGGIDSGV